MDLGEAVLTLRVDTAQLTPELEKAKEKTNAFTEAAKLATVAIALFAAGKEVVKFLQDCVKEFTEAEGAATRLAGALKVSGEGGLVNKMLELSSALQKTTKFSDEASQGAMSLMMTIGGLTAKMTADTLPAVQDLATGLGIDLESAAMMVSKAMNGNVTALQRYGIHLDSTLKGTEAMTATVKALEERFGGLAVAIGDTASAKLVQLKNSFGDLKEEVGRGIVTAIRPLVEWLTKQNNIVAENLKSLLLYRDALNAVAKGTATEDQVLISLVDRREVATRKLNALIDAMKRMDNGTLSNIEKGKLAAEAAAAGYDSFEKYRTVLLATVSALGRQIDAHTKEKQALEAESAAAAAAAKAKTQYLEDLNDAYIKTDAYKKAFLEGEIERWEKAAKTDKENIDKINALLADLREQYSKFIPTLEAVDVAFDTNLRGIKRWADNWNDAFAVVAPEVEDLRNEFQDLEDSNRNMVDHSVAKVKEMSAEWKANFDLIKTYVTDAMRTVFTEIGRSLATGELSWKSFGETVLKVIGKIVSSMGDQLAADAAVDLVKAFAALASVWGAGAAPGWFASAAIKGAGAAAAWVTGGALSAVQLHEGGDFVVPPGYPNDSFPMRVESGEHVSVTPAGGGGDMIHNTLVLDGSVLADWVTRASRNKKILTTARSVVP